MSTAENYRAQRERIYVPPESGNRTAAATPATKIDPTTNKFKDVLKTQEAAAAQMREEIILLKQIERRYQKQVEVLEAQNADAPRMIKALREELAGLKNKMKEIQHHRYNDERRLRVQGEEIVHLQQVNAHLEAMAEAKDLKERSELADQLAYEQHKVMEKEHMLSESQRRQELVEKNLNLENRNLRSKLLSVEHENRFLKDRLEQLEETIREKGREIASLAIYRYSAMHRKPEPCKACLQRQYEEKELERQRLVIERLPRLTKPEAVVLSAKSVRLTISLPVLSDQVQYDCIQLLYGEDLNSTDSCTSLVLEPPREGDGRVFMDLDGFTTGKYYHFRLVAYSEEFESAPSDAETVLVDLPPMPPTTPTVGIRTNPLEMNITVLPPSDNGGSSVSAYRLYHATLPAHQKPASPEQTPAPREFFLLAELKIPVSSPDAPLPKMMHRFKNPQVGVLHIFRASAVNSMGESSPSEECRPCLLDLPPEQPKPPVVKKFGTDSVQVTIVPPKPNGGSELSGYEIHYAEVIEGNPNLHPQVLEVANPRLLVQNIDGLEPGAKYVFAALAKNAAGVSELSRYGEQVCLDLMLPAPVPPQCLILSPSTVKFLLCFDTRQVKCPPLTGYRLYMSTSHNVTAEDVVCPFIPFREAAVSEHTISTLDYGGSYYCAVSLLSAQSESAISPAVWVSLAAAIPLPQTPSRPSTPVPAYSPPAVASPPPLPPASLNRATSRSIDLTLSQRIQNMYRGNPAFALPDDIKRQAEVEGVAVNVNLGAPRPTSRRSSITILPPNIARGASFKSSNASLSPASSEARVSMSSAHALQSAGSSSTDSPMVEHSRRRQSVAAGRPPHNGPARGGGGGGGGHRKGKGSVSLP
ncbi:hypothetical protein RI367_007319 [Sorochytrium milnesiophthora]